MQKKKSREKNLTLFCSFVRVRMIALHMNDIDLLCKNEIRFMRRVFSVSISSRIIAIIIIITIVVY